MSCACNCKQYLVKVQSPYELYIGTKGSVGYDIKAIEDSTIHPNSVARVKTGIFLDMPEGLWCAVYGRSSLNSLGIFVLTGIVDTDYKGEIQVVMYNSTNVPFHIKRGDRIAQLVFHSVANVKLSGANVAIGRDVRGQYGFGSTNDVSVSI